LRLKKDKNTEAEPKKHYSEKNREKLSNFLLVSMIETWLKELTLKN